MRLKIELVEGAEEEIRLTAPAFTDEVRRLQAAITQVLAENGEISLKDGDRECFVAVSDLLFFETDNGRVRGHTVRHMYTSDRKLYELEALLPRTFVRAGKSCLVNTAHICSINHSITGVSEVRFKGTEKKIFASRMYYKLIRETIKETRLIK